MALSDNQKIGLGILGTAAVVGLMMASQGAQETPPEETPVAPPRIRPDLLQPTAPDYQTPVNPILPPTFQTTPTLSPGGIGVVDKDEAAFFARWGRYRTTRASVLLGEMKAGKRDALTMPLTLAERRSTTPVNARALLVYIDSPEALRGLSDVLLVAMLSSYDPKNLDKVKSPNVSEVFKFFFYHDFVFADNSPFVQEGLWALNWFVCQSVKRAGGGWDIQANQPTLDTPEGWYFSTACVPSTYGKILGSCSIHQNGEVIPSLLRYMKDAQAHLFEYTAIRLQNMIYLISVVGASAKMTALLSQSIGALGSVAAGVAGLASGNPAGFVKGLLDVAMGFVNFFSMLGDSEKKNETVQLTVGLYLESLLAVYSQKPLVSYLLGYQLNAISDDPPYRVESGARSVSPLARSNCLVREGLLMPFSCAGTNYPQLAFFARRYPFGVLTWVRGGRPAGIRARFAPVGPTINPFYAGKPIGAEVFVVEDDRVAIWRGEMNAPELVALESFDLGVLKRS